MPSTPWIVQGPAELRRAGDPEPRMVLLCFAPAGSGACYFSGWGARLPRWVDVWPVELPGRNTRSKEKPLADLKALVRDAADGLEPQLKSARKLPFALLGHSFGAWLAFELAVELRRRGCGEPVKIYASANRAPCLAGPEHDPDTRGASLCLPPASFWPHFEQRYGANPDLQSPAVRAFLYPLLQADFCAIDSYHAASEVLQCPIAAIGAHGDARYRTEQISAWKAHTSGEFQERWFTAKPVHKWATPHRFVADDPSDFQSWLTEDLCMQFNAP